MAVVALRKNPLLPEIGLIGLGFGAGVLFASLRADLKEKDLLDRISWRNPEDYFFMKWQREQAAQAKPKFKIPEFGFLKKKKEKLQQVQLDPQTTADRIKKQVENQISAKEEATVNYKKFEESRRQMAEAGISAP